MTLCFRSLVIFQSITILREQNWSNALELKLTNTLSLIFLDVFTKIGEVLYIGREDRPFHHDKTKKIKIRKALMASLP